MNDQSEKALQLFEEISSRSNEVLYTIAFSACAALFDDKSIQLGKPLFHQMPKMFFNDIIVINSAIHMMMKFGEIEIAEDLFSKINKPNTYTYGIMMNGYNINEEPHKCLKIFQQLQQKHIELNEAICISLIGAASQIGMRSVCQSIIPHISNYLQNNIQLNNSLIDMWVSHCLFICWKKSIIISISIFFLFFH